MWNWFGGAGAQKRKDGPKNAILLLRQQLDMLQKRERHLQSQMTDQDALAKKHLANNNRTGGLGRRGLSLATQFPLFYDSYGEHERWKELIYVHCIAAKAALRRKQVHERSLEQTDAQIAQVEQQIYSIEAANINQETLNAMKTAGRAMRDIHGNLTIDKVDETMYAEIITYPCNLPYQAIENEEPSANISLFLFSQEELREQHALGEEIATAISSAPIGEPINEEDLEEELERMEQEQIDEKMLKTGTVPIADLPGVANGPIKGKNKVPQQAEEEDEEEELRKLQAEMAM